MTGLADTKDIQLNVFKIIRTKARKGVSTTIEK
jgi:hypothetical protein